MPSEEGADDLLSDSEEDWWNDQAPQEIGVKVQIFFTRNSKFIGKKDTTIPRGGFYPTVCIFCLDVNVFFVQIS